MADGVVSLTEEAERLALELAAATGEEPSRALVVALRERLERIRGEAAGAERSRATGRVRPPAWRASPRRHLVDFLASAGSFDGLEIERDRTPAREIEL